MATKKITFAAQAQKFLADSATRKNNPLRPASLKTYRSQIETHLIPKIGKLLLQDVGNKVVKQLFADLAADHASPATIQLNFTIIKKIRKSAVSEDGDILFPYEWNTEFLDLPSGESKTVTVEPQTVQDAISQLIMPEKALAAILAGTGLRIAEALALRLGPDDKVGSYWIPEDSKMVIRQQRTDQVFGPTKTSAGVREIDLAPELNNFLIDLYKLAISTQVTLGPWLMFPSSETIYRDKFTKVGIQGFHALRRFRTTHLNKMNCPTGLEYFWMGHAAKDVHSGYINFGKEIESRKIEAARIGLGFELPEVL